MRIRRLAKLGLVALGLAAAALSWGYWYSASHYVLHLRVEDYGLKTDRRAFAAPHDVALTYFSAEGSVLASARSVEPLGFLVPVHPDPKIDDCRQFERDRQQFARCFERQSSWVSGWANRVRFATVGVGGCTVENARVEHHESDGNWWLWWVPHPHIGGVPRRFVELTVRIDSKECRAVERYQGR